MDSKTKNRQHSTTLRAMVERAYGRSQVVNDEAFVQELTQGWFNVAYKVMLADGRNVVLKIAPSSATDVMTYERRLMRNELATMEIVRRHSNLPIPAVEYADTTRELCDADWFFMEYVDSENFGQLLESGRISASARESLMAQLGVMNRRLNSIVGHHFGPVAGEGSQSWWEAYMDLVSDLLDDGRRADVDLGYEYGEILSIVANRSAVLDDIKTPRLVASDLWPSNVLIRDDTIVAIIDHERAVYGDPLMESGFLGDELPIFPSAESFQRGYGAGALSARQRARRRLYSLHLMLVMMIEPSYRGLQDPQQYRWVRARFRDLISTI